MPNELLLTAQMIYKAVNPNEYIAWRDYNGKEAYIRAAMDVLAYFEKKIAGLEVRITKSFKSGQEQGYVDGTCDGIKRQLAEVTKLRANLADERAKTLREFVDAMTIACANGNTDKERLTNFCDLMRKYETKLAKSGQMPEVKK